MSEGDPFNFFLVLGSWLLVLHLGVPRLVEGGSGCPLIRLQALGAYSQSYIPEAFSRHSFSEGGRYPLPSLTRESLLPFAFLVRHSFSDGGSPRRYPEIIIPQPHLYLDHFLLQHLQHG